jgi:signal transduction histidine kinase
VPLDDDPELESGRADRRRLEALLANTDSLWQPAPFLAVAAEVVRQATLITPGIECLISIVPPERPSHFRMVAGAGPWAEAQVGKEWPWLGTVAGGAMSERRVIETTRLQQESVLATTLAEGAIETGRLIPLSPGEHLPDGRIAMGVLGFYRTGSRPFTDEERSVMDEFGKRVSLALHRAELLDAAQRTNERLRTGIELTLELASELDDREIIRHLLRRAVESVDADRASLSLVEGSEMIVQDGYDRDGRRIPATGRYRIPPGSTTDRAVRTGRPKVGEGFDRGQLDAASRDAHSGTRHHAVIPLTLGGRVGAILLLTRRRDRPFAREDVDHLQLIGNAAAVALRNAELYGQAHDLSRTKSDFMNLAAHELRTPLSVVIGYLSMLQDGTFGPPPASWVQPLAVLSAKSAELGVLVEDLLVAARLEAGTMPTAISEFDLCAAVRESLARCEPRAALLGADVDAELPMEPVPVRADPDHVARIIDNLVNNALTYTVEKPVIRIRVAADPDPEVVVSDSGLGIPPELAERVFERFYRIDHPELPRQPGTGLGLAISRELAERYGGRLELLPAENGATFRLTLPGL